jgi:uncharacterized OB-fold protein
MGSNSQLQEAAERGVEATYFAALTQGKLMIQRCADCKRAIFYPQAVLPALRQRDPHVGAGVRCRDRALGDDVAYEARPAVQHFPG